MSKKLRLFAAAFLVSLTAISTSADPVLRFAEMEKAFDNQPFGSNFLFEVGLSPDAVPHQVSATNKNLREMAPSVDFMSAPEICVQAPAVTAPEPATMILLGTGLIGIGAVVRRARKKQRS